MPLDFYDAQIKKLDLFLEQHAKVDDADTFYRLMSIPGVGRILAITLLKRECPQAKAFAAAIEKKHNKTQANTLLAIKLGRAVYWMRRKIEFGAQIFTR